ncbi:MAG TPA: hypothetical protein PKE16_11865 [Hyphomicrobium sp.]|nr:hypothetical protein [Hyphomicrobium sp.]
MTTQAVVHPSANSVPSDFAAYFDPSSRNFGKRPKVTTSGPARSIYGFHRLLAPGDVVTIPMSGNRVGHALAKSVTMAHRKWRDRHDPGQRVELSYDWGVMTLKVKRVR